MSIFRITIVYPLTLMWAAFFVWMGVSFVTDAPRQIQKDKDFINHEINPNIVTIDSFKVINKRLPSVNEFEQIKNSNSNQLGIQFYIRDSSLIDNEIKNKVKGMNWDDNYVVAVWRGEWNEYYISRNHEYITNDYQLKDAVKDMAFSFVFATILPGIVLFLRNRRVKRSTLKSLLDSPHKDS